MVSLKQPSFFGGMLSPQVLSRSDQKKYSAGMLLCNNALVQRFGSLQSRPGTIYLDTESLNTNSAMAWSNSVFYYTGNVASRLGIDYVALSNGSGSDPAVSPLVWRVLSTTTFRLVKFVFNFSNSYELIFSVNNIRIYKNGSPILIPLASMTAWVMSTAYVIGNVVSSGGFGWICQTANAGASAPGVVAGQWMRLTISTGSTYILDIPVNSNAQGASPVAGSFLNIPQASLSVLQAVNLNDVMTVTSQYFQPFQLTRFSDTDWRITPFISGTSLQAPTGVNVVAGVGGGATAGTPIQDNLTGGDPAVGPVNYVITSYNATGESVASNDKNLLHGPSAGNPVGVSWLAASGTPLGYMIYRTNIGSGSPGPWGLIAIVSGSLAYSDGNTVNPAYPAKQPPFAATGQTTFVYVVTAISAADGSESLPSAQATAIGGTPTVANPNVISWTPEAGVSTYRVYRIINGIPGLVGVTTLTGLNDSNIQPDFSQQPPSQLVNPDGTALFQTAGNWPATCTYYQQRICFANTVNEPTAVWMSHTGSFSNFTVSTPVIDTDAINFVIAGKSAQPIIAMVDLRNFIIHTASAEYVCTGNQFGTITPSAITLTQQGSSGASLPAPVVIGDTDIYVQARGSQLRDLQFRIGSYTYAGQDVTIFSTQMFQNLTVVDMDWQNIKDSTVWCVMSNGVLYGMTYIREQEIWAWHQHPMVNGFVENVVVVPNANADTVYLIVRRVINGQTVRYFEQLSVRDYNDTVFYTDFIGMDASLTYNGTITDGSTLTATTSGGWTPGDLLTLTSSTAKFAAADVTNHNQVVLSITDPTTGLVTDRVTFSILTYVSTTVVQGYAQRVVPAWAQALPASNWGIARTTFSGAAHLAGQNLSIFGDGNVIASPLNSGPGTPGYTIGSNGYPIITCSLSGTFTIPDAALVVSAGLPMQMDVQTMPLENSQGETIANKHVQVMECCPIFYLSRGGLYGQDFNHLRPWKQPRGLTPPPFSYGYPVAPYTGPARIPIQGSSELTGQVCIRNVDPVPISLSGIIVTAEVGNS